MHITGFSYSDVKSNGMVGAKQDYLKFQ